MKRILPAAAVAVILVLGLPSVVVPEAVAVAPTQAPVGVGGGSIHGYVRSDLGGPLGGAVVTATRGDGEPQTAWTDPDGAYAFKLAAGTWTLNVTARAHHAARDTAVVLASDLPVTKNFTLNHSGAAITGRVLDAKTGRGVAGAWVEAHPSSAYDCKPGQPCPLAAAEADRVAPEYYRMPHQTRSGPDGAYGLAIESSEQGRVQLRAWAEGYRDAWMEAEVRGDTRQDLVLQPVPPRTAALAGRVLDAKTGAPVSGAWVSAWPAYDEPAGVAGSTEPAPGGAAGSPGAEGGSGTATTTMPAKPAPAPEACCREGNSTTTSADGTFRMALHAGSYHFSVGAPDYGQHGERIALADGEAREVQVRLQPIPANTVTLRGAVVDRATGQAVAGAWVSVENQQWGHYDGATTGADGRFELRTKPGWTLVWVRLDGQGYAQPAEADAPASTAVVEPGPDRPGPRSEGSYYPWVRGQSLQEGQSVDLRVELQPKPKPESRLQGYVLDAATKKPLAGAYVNIHNEDTGDWGWGRTDQHGSFVFQARAGVHTVHANAEGHFGNAVMVTVSGPATRVDLALQEGQSQGYCCVAYAAKDGAVVAEGRAGSGSAPGAGAPPPSPGPASQGEVGAADANAQLAGSGPATYGATGESLGPYDPAKAPAPGAAQTGANATPGFAPLLGLAALGAAAVLLARRRR